MIESRSLKYGTISTITLLIYYRNISIYGRLNTAYKMARTVYFFEHANSLTMPLEIELIAPPLRARVCLKWLVCEVTSLHFTYFLISFYILIFNFQLCLFSYYQFRPKQSKNTRDLSKWVRKETINAFVNPTAFKGSMEFFVDWTDCPDRYVLIGPTRWEIMSVEKIYSSNGYKK